MKFKTKNELLNKMHSIVNNFMESYQSDFTEFDLARLKNKSCETYVWMVRDCGTALFNKRNLYCNVNMINYYLGELNPKRLKFYEVELANNSIKLIKDMPKYMRENIR